MVCERSCANGHLIYFDDLTRETELREDLTEDLGLIEGIESKNRGTLKETLTGNDWKDDLPSD